MQKGYTILSGRNAMSKCGILRVCFDTFSSKNEYGVTFTNNYNQSCSVDFRGCSSNGKEKDYESGFHYYGARYYWSEVLTGWLSVDPMMDKYPSFSSYNYCRWNPVKRVDVDGLFDSEKQAQKTQDRAVKRFGADRVGDVFNKGTAEKPNYSFHVYGPGKDNKTHGESGDNGVWAYKPDATISSNLGLFKYTYLGAERDNKLSVSLTFGGQLEGSVANIGAKLNIGSVDLFGIDVDLDNGLIYSHYADENNAQGSAGVGVGVGVLSAGYSCRYKGGDYYDKGSVNHTVRGRVLGAGVGSSAGNIEFGAGAALFFGIDIRLTSTIRK